MEKRRRGVGRKKLKKCMRNCWSVVKDHAMEFCRNTGLHGYKYIGESHRFIRDRIVWAITVFASLCIAIVIIKISYVHYSENRIYSVIKSTHHGIWNYPFPAVTVCDINRVSLELTRKFVDKLDLPPSVSKEFIVHEMSLLNELLYPGQNSQNIRNNLSRLQYIFESNDLSIPTVVNAVTQNCESLLKSCRLKTFDVDCNTIFEPSVSRDGLCCSFNYITREKYFSRTVSPRKITSCGYQSGLTFLIELNPDDYHASFVGSVGIKVMLHDPYDYPDFDTTNQLITSQRYSFMTVIPIETYSTENVRELPVSDRHCLFQDEWEHMKSQQYDKQTFAFTGFSYRNCLTECRANVIKTKCGCIPYYYQQNETRVCNLKDIDCLEAYKFWYESAWPGTDFSPKVEPVVNRKNMPCGCKLDCNFYVYNVEKSEGILDNRISHTGLNYSIYNGANNTWDNKSIIHIFFGDLVSLQYRRDVRYSWRHVFATFGGLLGLFAGFSLMSIFECTYFFVVRIITDTYSQRKNRKNVALINYM
ncbi:sodium channel protein Nach [Lasioglossum baleicum]|uniref:sodium channel protein Nach n=1 Tax=Lasioglossum baleicum TaxID=434251 RepID=UPI003FCC8763